MKSKKYYKLILLAMISLLVITSCGPQGKDDTQAANNTDISLRLTTTFGSPETLDAVLRQYSELNKNVRVVVNKPTENDEDAWLLRVSDLLILSSSPTKELNSGLINLEPYISSTNVFTNKPLINLLDGCKMDSKQYGLPIGVRPTLLYSNTVKIQELGLRQLTSETTIDELKSAIDTVAQNNLRGNLIGFLEAPSRLLLKSLILRAYDNNKDLQALQTDLSWYVNLVKMGVIKIAGADNFEQEWVDSIEQGIVTYWFEPFSGTTNTRGDYSYAIQAVSVSKEFNLPASPICIAVNQATQQHSEAWDLANFLFSNYPVGSINEGVVTNQFLETTPTITGSINPLELSLAVKNALFDGATYNYSSIFVLVDKAISGEASIENGLSDPLVFDSMLNAAPPDLTSHTSEIVTPQPEVPIPAGETVEGIKAFIDPTYLNTFDAIKVATETYNQNNPSAAINLLADRIEYSSGYTTLFDAENFDCFAAPAAVIHDRINDETLKNQFSDLILPLDPLLDSSVGSQFRNSPQILNSVTLDGKVMGYPISIIPNLIYFNKTDLDKLGIETPELTWGVAEFWEIMNRVGDRSQSRYGFAPLMTSPEFLFSESAFLVETEQGIIPNYASNEVRALLEALRADAASGAIYPYHEGGSASRMGNHTQRDGLIAQGKVLFWYATSYSTKYNPISAVSGEAAEVEVLPLPGDNTYNASQVIALFISKNAKNPQGCWNWFNFLAQNQSYLFEGIPLNPAILESAAWERSVGASRAKVYKFLAENLIYTEIQEIPFSAFRQWWNDLVKAAYSDENLDAAIALVQDKATNTLQCIKDANPNIKKVINLYGTEVDECARRFDPSMK